MIISVSGRIGSGKDTVGEIIQFLMYQNYYKEEDITIKDLKYLPKIPVPYVPNQFIIKKFADKLKDIVCLLINCTREQLEDQKFKETELGEEWDKWLVQGSYPESNIWSYYTTLEEAEESVKIDGDHWMTHEPTIDKIKMTPRLLLQLLGTQCGRNIIHPNIWINSLMSEYKCITCNQSPCEYDINNTGTLLGNYPNWIITDTRFPNELKAIKDKGGISIRVNRRRSNVQDENGKELLLNEKGYLIVEHESETALDNAMFDYVIENNSSIEDLIDQVKQILIKEKILNK